MTMPFEPIAIIGTGCVLPDALNAEALWRVVLHGRSVVRRAQAGYWRAQADRLLPDSNGQLDEGALCDVGGFVDTDAFEAGFTPYGFAIDPALVQQLDPAVQWTLHAAREALTEAGLRDSQQRQGRRIGAILGNLGYPSRTLAEFAEAEWGRPVEQPHPVNRFWPALPAQMLRSAFGLQAAYTLDAACASSLYAIKLACDRLQAGRADVMIAGGANGVEGLFLHAGFTALGALSPTGQSRPFHREADGLLPAEGVALVVLKRVAAARADGDRVLGVIRGIGLSNDGRAVGMLRPDSAGQLRALRAAYSSAAIDPAGISLIECHATGTVTGDATEIQTLRKMFGPASGLPIGSLKSNMGHLVTASGAAALLKVLKAMENRVRPPTLHTDDVADIVAASGFRVLRAPEPWDTAGPLRAAISGFGFGGVNAHMIVEDGEALSASQHVVQVRVPAPRLAVTALAIRGGADATDPVAAWLRGAPIPSGALQTITPPGERLRMPPRDLDRTLPQHTLMLATAMDALGQVSALPRERTSVLIGMQVDADTCRLMLRLRLFAETGVSPPDLLVPRHEVATATGCMANILANRINRQADLAGPSFSISADELSGLRALEIAAEALARDEIDAALVGAVDLTVEPVNAAATAALLGTDQPALADAACAMIVCREADAVARGDRILALIDLGDESGDLNTADLRLWDEHSVALQSAFGRAHAAQGLLEVAAAIETVAAGLVPPTSEHPAHPLLPSARPAGFALEVSDTFGQSMAVRVAAPDPSRAAYRPAAPERLPAVHVFHAPDLTGLLDAIERGQSATPAQPIDPTHPRVAFACNLAELPAKRTIACELVAQAQATNTESCSAAGVFFRRHAMEGEVAAVYTGSSPVYRGAGMSLLQAVPSLVRDIKANEAGSSLLWLLGTDPSASDQEIIAGAAFVSLLHANAMRRIGLRPQAAIGFCQGEICALAGQGAWDQDLDAMVGPPVKELCDIHLGGESRAVQSYFSRFGIAGAKWANYAIRASVEELMPILATEPAVCITIRVSPSETSIGGEEAACRRVVERIGSLRAHLLPLTLAVHCPAVRECESAWRDSATVLPTHNPDGVRFYSNAFNTSYQVTRDSVADAYTAQAVGTIDFPATILRAWHDGVRIFVEHGPRGACTRAITETLRDRPHVAVCLDRAERSGVAQFADAVVELIVAGVPLELAALGETTKSARSDLTPEAGLWNMRREPVAALIGAAMPAADPDLVPVNHGMDGPLAELHAAVSRTHAEFVSTVSTMYQRFLSGRYPAALPVAVPMHVPSVPIVATLAESLPPPVALAPVALLLTAPASAPFPQRPIAPAAHEKLPAMHVFHAPDLTGLLDAIERGRPAAPAQAIDPTHPRVAFACDLAGLPAKRGIARELVAQAQATDTDACSAEGVFFRRQAMAGEVAAVYTAGAAYPGAGLSLIQAIPSLVRGIAANEVGEHLGCLHSAAFHPTNLDLIVSAAFVSFVHANATRRIGFRPQAAIGLCQGEFCALLALGDGGHDINVLGGQSLRDLCEIHLGGEARAVRSYLSRIGVPGTRWVNYAVQASVEELLPILATEPAVSVTIRSSPTEAVIGGEEVACRRVVDQIGSTRAVLLLGTLAIHCPVVRECEATWRDHCTIPTRNPDGVRFYSNAFNAAYDVTSESFAEAYTAQAVGIVDFPATILRAWDDGVRIFVEHGPRRSCTRAIAATLGDRPYVAVSLDQAERPGITQFADAVAELIAAGVPLDLAALEETAKPARSDHAAGSAAVSPAVVRPPPAPLAAPEPAGPAPAKPRVPQQASRLPYAPVGPVFDRKDLEELAGGKVSNLFGPLFRQQDGYARQVRMPEPPLLLADRVTGIDAEPGVLGAGCIWTETDIREGAWYLHHGRMLPGLFIEAGQADLLLASWMGVDFINKGERVYRLLGCDLTYHGPLPAVGETLRYAIVIDRHARLGELGMFFFRYDCYVGDTLRLSVREGQAGFFSDDDLANSGGVAWSPETDDRIRDRSAGVDPPRALPVARSFSASAVRAVVAGRLRDVFGEAFLRASCHVRTPNLPATQMMQLGHIPAFDPQGGPWGRGYLRVEVPIEPDAWFFEGHFKNDRCMPGTVMFDGCLQAMAFFMMACGHTLDRDGWRFVPVPEQEMRLRCRGQVRPTSRLLTLEVFVDSFVDGPEPTLVADVLGTVDGLKAFHGQRVALQLTPDWPFTEGDPLYAPGRERKPAASHDGHFFDEAAMLACSFGRESLALGPAYGIFDEVRRAPRLPNEDYLFVSRIVTTSDTFGRLQTGSFFVAEYDVPPGAWYFADNGQAVMPFAVLMEVVLQPCGVLSNYVGVPLNSSIDLLFRNLDGDFTVFAEVEPSVGTLTTTARLTKLSRLGTTYILAFEVETRAADRVIIAGTTAFGYFPPESLRNQQGLPSTADEAAWIAAPAARRVDLTAAPFTTQRPRLGIRQLQLIEWLTADWPTGGRAGLGVLRAEKRVRAEEWMFRRHFFHDPVQPGSLGVEASLQLLQAYAIDRGLADGMRYPCFESAATGERIVWTFRGQVVPENARTELLIEILRIDRAPNAVLIEACASLWVDGRKIYAMPRLVVRVRDGLPAGGEDHLDPTADAWIGDHRPALCEATVPIMGVLDRLAEAALRTHPGRTLVSMENVALQDWLIVPKGGRRVRGSASALDGESCRACLEIREPGEDGRYTMIATTLARFGSYPPAPAPLALPPLGDPGNAIDPAEIYSGLFHGPLFHVLRTLTVGRGWVVATIDAAHGRSFAGTLNVAMLDGIFHALPLDRPDAWFDAVPVGMRSYPTHIEHFTLYGAVPMDGAVEIRAERIDGAGSGNRRLRVRFQILVDVGVRIELVVVLALFPMSIGSRIPANRRRAFLAERQWLPGLGLGEQGDGESRFDLADLVAIDAVPGTAASIFNSSAPDRAALLRDIAVKAHAAELFGEHPAFIVVDHAAGTARNARQPLEVMTFGAVHDAQSSRVRTLAGPNRDLSLVRRFWLRALNLRDAIAADLLYAVLDHHVARFGIDDPDACAREVPGPTLLLAAAMPDLRQTAVSPVATALLAGPVLGRAVLALVDSSLREGWLGALAATLPMELSLTAPELVRFHDPATDGARAAVLEAHARRDDRPLLLPSGADDAALIDVVVRLHGRVVPVGITGGGSVPLVVRLGKPIEPDATLGPDGYARQVAEVLAVMRGDETAVASTAPLPADTEAAGRALLRDLLARVAAPSVATRAVLSGDHATKTPLAIWLRLESGSHFESRPR